VQEERANPNDSKDQEDPSTFKECSSRFFHGVETLFHPLP
jgi:hypothetical protein